MPLQASGAKGVVLDVEPYLTDGWKDRAEVLRQYVDGMCRAREAADRAGIELIACTLISMTKTERRSWSVWYPGAVTPWLG